MAYVIEKRQRDLEKVKSLLPIASTLKNNIEVELDLLSNNEANEVDRSELNRILNESIEEGNAYPQESILSKDQFAAYYLTHEVFVLKIKETKQIVGAFYVKPNFPGRCDHYCNGGFIVDCKFRNLGAGRIMGFYYLRLANLLGYKASFFNLVFANNKPSLALWRNLGFKELNIIPEVGRLKDGTYVDAHQFYYDLSKVNLEEKL